MHNDEKDTVIFVNFHSKIKRERGKDVHKTLKRLREAYNPKESEEQLVILVILGMVLFTLGLLFFIS